MSVALDRGPAAPSLLARVDRLAGVRAWWLSAACWGALALLAAMAVQLQLAWAWAPAWPVLGAGRLVAAYRLAARLGAFALPLMALLARAPKDERADPDARGLGWVLLLWNLGLAVGVTGVLLGWMRPEPWAPQPALADLLLLIAAVGWLRRLWLLAGPAPDAASRAAVAAGIGLLACLAVGSILVQALGGLGQALGGAVMGRGLDDLWLTTMAFGAGAVLLPRFAGRPLFGRRSWTWGLWAWLAWAVSRLPADLVPDLLGPRATRIMDTLAPLGLAPLVMIGVALAGSFLGAAPSKRSQSVSSGSLPPGPSAGRASDPALLLVGLGLAWLVLARMTETVTIPSAARLLQFGVAAPRAAELPVWTGWWCLSAGLIWLLAVERDLPRGRWVAGVTVLAAAVQGALVLPLALVALAVGPSAEILGLEAALRLPATGLLLGVWVTMAVLLGRQSRDGGTLPVADAALPARLSAAVGPGLYGASVAAVLGAGLLMSVIVPLASQRGPEAAVGAEVGIGDPGGPGGSAMGGAAAADLSSADSLSPGRRVYVAEGCVFCHTTRLREGWDPATLGPPKGMPGMGTVPALAGLRRAGPDLTWVGDRLQDASERVAVHAIGGRPAFPWLFDAAGAGPSPAGSDLMDYLAVQRSVGQGSP